MFDRVFSSYHDSVWICVDCTFFVCTELRRYCSEKNIHSPCDKHFSVMGKTGYTGIRIQDLSGCQALLTFVGI